MTQTMDHPHLTRLQLFSGGAGSVCYDLYKNLMFSFGLVFYIKVAALSNQQAGLVLICGQVTTFTGSLVFGQLCDHVDVPYLSRLHGRKKTWHLFGVLFGALFIILAFSRCLLCPEPPQENSWLGFGYFTVAYGMACFWMAGMELSYLSFVPEFCTTDDEVVILNSIRTILSYLGGICSYGLAWLFLGQSSDESLSPQNSMDFTKISSTMSAIGLLLVVSFHVGSRSSPKRHAPREKRKSSILQTASVFSPSVMYVESIGAAPAEGGEGRKKSSLTSVMRKISTYVVPFDPEITLGGDTHRKESTASPGTLTNNGPATITEMATELGNQPQNVPPHRKTHVGRPTEGITRVSRAGPPPLQGLQQEANIQGGIEDADDGEPSPKRTKELLKDPRLYKVVVIYFSAYSLENLMFTYFALYLIEHLHFEKEATAYVTVIFLVSGICGCAISKKLNSVMGRKWTWCLATTLTMPTAAWFYFVTESTKQMVYGPVVLIGCCVSIMVVMGLSYIEDFASEDQESSGFVCSLASATQKVVTGGMLMLIQSFYPSSGTPCRECGDYVRIAYPVALAFLPLVGLLVVIFTEVFPSLCCRKNEDPPAHSTVVSNPLAGRAELGILSEANGLDTRL